MTREPRDSIERMLTYSGLVAEAASVAKLQEATGLAVVDMVCIMPFDGGPDEPSVWVVLATEAERRAAWTAQASVADAVKALLVAGGYPSVAAQTALVRLASKEIIDESASKGRDYFR